MSEYWLRQSGESAQAFEAFCIYRDDGVDRNLQTVAQKCTKSVSLIHRWSTQWNWVERSAAYDAYLESAQRSAAEDELVLRARLHITEQRAEELQNTAWEHFKKVLARAEQMLDWPLAAEYSEDGKQITKAAHWTKADAAALYKVSLELAEIGIRFPSELWVFLDMLKKRNIPASEVFADLITEFANVPKREEDSDT